MSARDGDRFELLAAASEVDDGTLSLQETVERLLEIVVPAFADLATIDAVSESGELRRLGARVDAPHNVELERALVRRRRVSDGFAGFTGTAQTAEGETSAGTASAIASGASGLLTEMSDEQLRALADSDEDYQLLRSAGLRAAMFVPLRAGGRTLGALACAVGASGRDYSEWDLRFAEVLAGRIALALDNSGLSQTVSGLEQRLEATLANLAEAVLVRDASGRIVFANAASARLLGVGSVEEVVGAARGTLMARFDVSDEHGRPLSLADLPSAGAQRGELPEPMLVRNVVRATGQERWLLNKATPVFDPDGQVSLVVSVIEDLTEVKRAELTQRLLAQAGKELSSSLDYEQTLQRVVRLAVPELADWAAIVMLGQGDVLEQVAAVHVDPGKLPLLRELGQRYPVRLTDPTGPADVIRSGRALLVREITDQLLEEVQPPEDQLALVRELEMRSLIIVPLAIAGRQAIGTLTLVMAQSGRLFDANDRVLAEELGRRAATAVDNARLYTERSRIATTLQRSLLPPQLPEIPGFRLAGLYRPAGQQNEVGGDFYDAFEVPGGWMVLVGDVAGRGAEAAALTSLSRYTLRAAGKLLGEPIAVLGQLNAALRERPELSLVSVCCALVRESGAEADVELVLAGHPPAYHLQGDGVRQVGVFAPFLGAYDSANFEASTVRLAPRDQLVLYTDGVIDTVGQTERFGEDRLARVLRDARDATDAVYRIDQAVSRFAHGPQVDDTAVLVIERSPSITAGAAGFAKVGRA